jgi:hypothetical protein
MDKEVTGKIPPDAPIWVVGKAELLFYMRRRNINKYIYFFGHVDAAADKFEPGGFAGMLDAGQKQNPVLYVLARIEPRKFASKANSQRVDRTMKRYAKLKHCKAIGGGLFLVSRAYVDQWYPVGAEGCLKRS